VGKGSISVEYREEEIYGPWQREAVVTHNRSSRICAKVEVKSKKLKGKS
jgi:hypothetical protein